MDFMGVTRTSAADSHRQTLLCIEDAFFFHIVLEYHGVSIDYYDFENVSTRISFDGPRRRHGKKRMESSLEISVVHLHGLYPCLFPPFLGLYPKSREAFRKYGLMCILLRVNSGTLLEFLNKGWLHSATMTPLTTTALGLL